MFEYTAILRVVPQLALAGAVALACETHQGLESADSTRRAAKNFAQKPTTTFAWCDALNLWDGVIQDSNVVFPPGRTYY